MRLSHDDDDGNSYATGMSLFNFTLPEEALSSSVKGIFLVFVLSFYTDDLLGVMQSLVFTH